MWTARFPSETLHFIALNLSLMLIISVLSQHSDGKMYWVDRLNMGYYYHLGQAY